MKTLSRSTRMMLAALAVLVAALVVAPAPLDAADAYLRMPGYVDFERLGIVGDAESTVDVFLKQPLLKIAGSALVEEDPDLAEMLGAIQLVRVHVYPLEKRSEGDSAVEKAESLSESLDKKGWDIVVRVREEDERTYVYVLPAEGDAIDGLVVMAIEEGDEAVFVNIVGRITAEQMGKLGRLGHHFDIDDLDIDFDEDGESDIKIKTEKKDKRTNR